VPAAADEVGDAEAVRRHRVLREHPEGPCEGPGRHVRHVRPVEEHRAGERPQCARERLQERGLPARVGAHDHRDGAPWERQVEPVDDDTSGVAGAEPAHLERRRAVGRSAGHERTPRASSQSR